MRKILSLALAIMMVFSMTIMASAENTTVLTTTVPDAKFVLNVPADQQIDFGTTFIEIGNVSVTDSSGFAAGKNLNVTVTYDSFSASGVSTTIPFTVATYDSSSQKAFDVASNGILVFKGNSNGSVSAHTLNADNMDVDSLVIKVRSADWGKALGGNYSATITFTAEVVVEE